LRGQYDDAIFLNFVTVVSHTSVKTTVRVLAGYVVTVLQNGSLELDEETDWSHISRSDQRSYINVRPHASGAVSEILEKYGWQVFPYPM
jgi:hypothetical protein